MITKKTLIAGLAAALVGLGVSTVGSRADGGITVGTIVLGVAGVAVLHQLNRAHSAYPSTHYVSCYPGTQDCVRQRQCHYGEIGAYHCHFY